MKQVVIENPVLNSLFNEPNRHFKFTDDGITDEIIDERRISSYFIPIAPPKKNEKEMCKASFGVKFYVICYGDKTSWLMTSFCETRLFCF